MLNPPSGVNTVSITVNSTDYISASSITYSNVDQTIPTYSVFGGYATAASFSINTLYQNNLLAGFFGSANNINGVSSGQTEIFNVGSASKSYCELSVKTSTSTLTSFGVTIAASADWEAVFIPIKPLNAVLLPIELTAFSGNYLDNKVQLKWSTATEKNNALFTVEKSSDGVNFVKLADIQSKGENGNSLFKLDYQTLDYAPFDNITYYRLKQTDFNGAFDISNMIAVWSNKKQTPSFSVYPNPTTGEITISTNQLLPKGTKIEIINHLGQKVTESSFFNQSLESKMIMNEDFKNGLYFIIIKTDDHILFKDGLIKQ